MCVCAQPALPANCARAYLVRGCLCVLQESNNALCVVNAVLHFKPERLHYQVVIAALNGSAWGGGFELALACDLRVMVSSAQMRLTEVKLGIIPGAGGTQRLPRLVGKSRAKELILTAAPVGAELGLNIGLVHRVVNLDAAYLEGAEGKIAAAGGYLEPLMDEVRAWALEIATAAPLSLRQAKIAIDQGFDRDLEAGLALETRAYLELVNSRDRLEGLAAFAEKRQPVYRGE